MVTNWVLPRETARNIRAFYKGVLVAVEESSFNRYEIDEKNAIIALQAILTTRGAVSEEKYQRFAVYLTRLPPHRALMVYGHAMRAISSRLEEGHPYREPMKKLGETITTNIGVDFASQVEMDPDFFESERLSLAENLNKISTLMQHFQDKAA